MFWKIIAPVEIFINDEFLNGSDKSKCLITTILRNHKDKIPNWG